MRFDGYDGTDEERTVAIRGQDQGNLDRSSVSRPYTERFVMLPRSTFTKPAKGLRARHLYLLITLYRLAFEGEFVRTTPRRLSHLTGIPHRSLHALIRPASEEARDGVLDRWVKEAGVRVHRVGGEHLEHGWHMRLEPADSGNFLKVPWWWLWSQDPVSGAAVVRTGWEPDDPGILAALAIAHVGYDFTTTISHGKTGLASIAGVSPRTMAYALADAEQKGWISVRGEKGGRGRTGGGFHGLHAARRNVVYVPRSASQRPIAG